MCAGAISETAEKTWLEDIPEIRSANCWRCGKATPRGYVFCAQCTPRYGETVLLRTAEDHPGKAIFVGSIPLLRVVLERIRGRRVVKWWMGTDALTMWMCPPGMSRWKVLAHQWKMRLLERFIDEHWVTGRRLLEDLRRAHGISPTKVAVVYWPGKYQEPIPLQTHQAFNAVYYDPGGGRFKRWVYGMDVIEALKERFPQVNWIRLDGAQDLRQVLPLADVYVRPSRHDGAPRIVEECRISGVPVIFSEGQEPDVDKIAKELEALLRSKEAGGRAAGPRSQ
jgi:hypothetical protein